MYFKFESRVYQDVTLSGSIEQRLCKIVAISGVTGGGRGGGAECPRETSDREISPRV